MALADMTVGGVNSQPQQDDHLIIPTAWAVVSRDDLWEVFLSLINKLLIVFI